MTRRTRTRSPASNSMDAFAASLKPVIADMVQEAITQLAIGWVQQQGLLVTSDDADESDEQQTMQTPAPVAQTPRTGTRSGRRSMLVIDSDLSSAAKETPSSAVE